MTLNTLDGKLKSHHISIEGNKLAINVDGTLYMFTNNWQVDLSVYRLEGTVEDLEKQKWVKISY